MRAQVLITGATSRIGVAAVEACVAAGMTVIATVRDDVKRGEGLLGGRPPPSVHVELLDVAAPDVGDKVRELLLKFGPIDGLVHHASIAVSGAFEEQSDRDIYDQLETNVFGFMAMTRALLPAMRSNGDGCIVYLSSIAGRVGIPGLAPFCATKHAVEGFCDGLRHEVGRFGIHVCVLEPGTLRMPLPASARRRGELVDASGPYAALTRALDRLLREGARQPADAAEVGRKIAQLLADPSPPFRTVVGGEARAAAALRRTLPDALFSSGLRRLMGL
jgi:NAD(P)-dependent dehydrogenase (short-subunit alcohol dehydrogenase family)